MRWLAITDDQLVATLRRSGEFSFFTAYVSAYNNTLEIITKMVYNNREMWDAYRLSAGGGFSLRKIVTMFFAVFFAALLVTITNSAVTRADSATWEGNNIKYGGKTYTLLQDAPTLPGIAPTNSVIYQSQEGDTVSIIALKEGFNRSQEITDAQIGTFKKDAGNNYSSAGPPVASLAIAASAEPAANADGTATAANGVTKCDISGIGWIICGPSRWIANGMDLVYGWISDFLTVKPLSTDTKSGLYQAWEIARGFANACFVVAFLIIIYSQITSFGISNYEIKKMIPKLIIAAVLVNISYYICAIAVDASNILGDSVQQAFNQIRESLTASTSNSNGTDWLSFKNITEYILSGGTVGAAVFAGKAAFLGATTGGTISSLAIMLAPVLVAGLLSVMVALIILAARQALITVLIVLAPLAFVAFLLPNTEKWFEKWRGIFTTMLMVFPMFSLLFGGSQLASYIILQNADQVTIVLLALFIQVAPLALTPFLLQFSGSLLGRLAGIVNNPQKGIVDRTRGWAKDQAETRRARGMEQVAKGGGTRFQRAAFKREKDRLNREGWKKRGENYLEADWHNDKRYEKHHDALGEAELRQKYGEGKSNLHFERRKSTDANLQRYIGGQRASEEAIKALQSSETAAWEEAKSNKMRADNRFAEFSTESKAILRSQKIADGQTMFAQSEQSDEWAKMVLSNEGLQAQIGGIGGKERALARATSEYRKNYGERIGEGKAVVDHFNLSGAEKQAHALGQTITVRDHMGNRKTFTADSEYTRESVIDTQIRQGTAEEIEGIIKVSGTDLLHYRTTIAQAVAEAKVSSKLIYAGGQTIDNIGQGNITGDAALDDMTRATILKGKIGAADLATNEPIGLKRLYNVAYAAPPPTMSPAQAAAYTAEVNAMKQAAYTALTNPSLRGTIKANARVELNKMIKNLGGTIYDPDGSPVTIDPTRNY